MIILGIALILVGWLTGVSVLYTIGAILAVLGLVLLLLGGVGVGGVRRGGFW